MRLITPQPHHGQVRNDPLLVRNARIFEDQRSFPLVLKEEYPLYAFRSIGIGDPLDEKTKVGAIVTKVASPMPTNVCRISNSV